MDLKAGLLIAALSVLLCSCVDPSSDSGTSDPPLARAPRGPAPPPPDHVVARHLLGLDSTGAAILPKWKTRRELNAERLSRAGVPGGTRWVDANSDYRNKSIDKFYATRAPLTQGLRTPAEYEAQQAYLLNWRSGYTSVPWKKLFMEIIKAAWGEVPVILLIKDTAHKKYIEQELKANAFPAAEISSTKYIIWWQNNSDAIWTRDYGPVSVVGTTGASKGKLAFADFRYYHTRPRDDEVPSELAKEWGVNVFRPDLDFEGGNFMTTSDGLCLSTAGVLWYNLGLSQSAVEQIFSDYLACQKSIFLIPMTGGVIAHIDMFAKLSSDTTMLVGEYTAKQHAANRAILDANAALVAKTNNMAGKPIQVIRIPMPDVGSVWIVYKLWRTYTNSLSVTADGKTGVVLIPTYDDETSNEKAAMAAYAKAYPGWKLVKIDSKIVIPGQGAIHCITMQIPAGKRALIEGAPKSQCGAKMYDCTPGGCGKVSATGCCDVELLKYCAKGKLRASDCATKPKCGWDKAKKAYACGSSGAADPAGLAPMSCGGLMPDMGPPDLLPWEAGPPDQALPDQAPPDQQLPDLALPDQALPDVAGPDLAADLPGADGAADSGADQPENRGCSCAASGDAAGSASLAAALVCLFLVARRRRHRPSVF